MSPAVSDHNEHLLSAASDARDLLLFTGVDLTEFTLFPKLPLELRFRIWRLSIGGPRVLNLNFEKVPNRHIKEKVNEDGTVGRRESLTYKYRCFSKDAVFNTLWVNQESRYETLRLKPKTFQLHLYGQQQTIYFNPKVDIIKMDDLSLFNLCLFFKEKKSYYSRLQGLEHIQNLAVVEDHPFITPLKGRFKLFPALKKLIYGIPRRKSSVIIDDSCPIPPMFRLRSTPGDLLLHAGRATMGESIRARKMRPGADVLIHYAARLLLDVQDFMRFKTNAHEWTPLSPTSGIEFVSHEEMGI